MLVEKLRHSGEEPELRLCIDHRGLNAVTKTDFFPLPHFQDTLDQISGATIFSTTASRAGTFRLN